MKIMRASFVPDVADWKRWWSVHVMGLGFGFSAIKTGLVAAAAGAGWFGALRREWAWLMVATLFVVGVLARVLRQPARKPESNAGKTTS